MWKRWVLACGILAVTWWLMSGDVPLLAMLRHFIGRGRRLTLTELDDNSDITESTEELTAGAAKVLGRDVDSDAYTLARIADSEHPTATLREKAAIMQVAVNDANKHGWSIGYTATTSKGYGRQSGRRYSTAKDPYEQTLTLAEAVLAGEVADETRGSTHFVHTTGFGSFIAYLSLAAKWRDEMGIVPVKLDGIASFRLFLPEREGYAAEDTLPRIDGALA